MGKYKTIKIKGKWMLEHRYVMEKHLKKKLLLKEIVHHKNGNSLDNRIENLCLTTRSSHTKYHMEKGDLHKINGVSKGSFKIGDTKGERNYMSKLTEDSVHLLRDMKETGFSQKDLAFIFEISQAHVSRVLRKVHWN